MASGLRPRPYLSAFRVFGCASGATGLPIIFMRYRGVSSSATFCRPPDSQIRLAALAVFGRRNGCRRGEECPLGMVKNLPAADGEEQLAL